MNISEIYLFCSTTSPACKPCFAFIKEQHLLAQEIQILRLDTKSQREKAKQGERFQIRIVPTLMVIYTDGDTSLYQGQRKVISWLFMRLKTFEQAQAATAPVYLPPQPEDIQRIPRPVPAAGEPGLYSAAPPKALTPEPEIEFLPNGEPPYPTPLQTSPNSPLDINARRQDKDTGMGDIKTAARKMEENRQSQIRSPEVPGNRAPSPIKQF